MRSIQYPIQLPPDFDQAQFDQRVRARGQAFAELEGQRVLSVPGLLLASCLIDFSSWTVTRVRLWANEASVSAPADAERFDVLLAVGPALNAAVRC